MATYDNDIMDKGFAEEVLDISNDYNKEDLDRKYHEAVARGVNSGDSDALADIDQAHATLSTLFTSNTDTVSASSSSYSSSPDYGFFDMFCDAASGIGNIVDRQREHDEEIGDIAIKGIYRNAREWACDKMDVSRDTDYPAPKRSGEPPIWYRIVIALLGAPIWRLAFAALVIWGTFSFLNDPTQGNDLIDCIVGWIIAIVLITVNTIGGFITNLVRRGINAAAESLLEWQIRFQEKAALQEFLASITTNTSKNADAGVMNAPAPDPNTRRVGTPHDADMKTIAKNGR